MASRTVVPDLARRRPLVVTDDPDLLDDLLAIAAGAGVEVDVAPDPGAARARYVGAPRVFVGDAVALRCVRAGLPRRPGVVLVCREDAAGSPWEAADALGADHVALLPSAAPWLTDQFAGTGEPVAGSPARVVAVVGGRGGAGASVLAAGLAVTGGRAGLRTLLVDADPLGGGIDLLLGWESLDGLRWPELSQTSGAVSPAALVEALPARGDLAVLSWDRRKLLSVPPPATEAALQAIRKGRELIVADLPRRLDDAAVLVLTAADLVLLVVPAELRACAAAAMVAAGVARHSDALSLVVRVPAPGGLRPGEISRALGLPLAGTLRAEPGLARRIERGEPPAGAGRGPLAGLCTRILADLGLTAQVAA